MGNPYFQFKEFTVYHDRCAMKVTTDGCLFGAWISSGITESCIGYPSSGTTSLLDIGTGSGLLSLMISQQNKLRIDAVEIDPAAAGQAEENVASSTWSDSIQVVNKDILQFIPQEKYNFIISNPPFYENELKGPDKNKNRAHHSSEMKLSALLAFITTYLHPDGKFFLLLPFKRVAESKVLLHKEGLFSHSEVIIKNCIHHPPSRMMVMGGKQDHPKTTSVLLIRNGEQYSPESIRLLKDYYLHM